MSNEVKTRFTGDVRGLDKAVADHKRSVERVAKDVESFQQKRLKDEERLTQHLAKQAEQRKRVAIKAFQDELKETERLLARRTQLENKYASDRSAAYKRAFSIPGGGAISAGAGALGIGLGVAGAVALTQQAIDKAIEQSKANRLIASSATEAGIAQSKLAESNRQFAAAVGLSDVAAATTTAQIQRLATNAGKPFDVDRLLKSFADLGAARGVGGKDLETLIGTILSGQDEGLNRLGISDPGQLQKAYAESVGKTTEELTQQEKVLAGLNAVIEKSAIFNGAAEARMNSLEGSVAKASAQYENLTNALATSFAQSYEFQTLVGNLATALGGMNKEVESLAELAKQGINIDIQVQALAKDSATVGFLKHLGIGLFTLAGGLGKILSPLDRPLGTRFGEAGRNLIEGATNLTPQIQQAEQERFIRDGVAATLADNVIQDKAAREQRLQKLNRDLAAIGVRQAERTVKDAEDAYRRLLTNPRATVEQLRTAQAGISKLGLSGDKSADLTQQFENDIQQALERIKKKQEEITQAKGSLFDKALSGQNNPFLDFLGNANKEMRSMLETAKVLSPALQQVFKSQLQSQNRSGLYDLRLGNNLEVDALRRQAQEFRQGFTFENDPALAQRARYYANSVYRFGTAEQREAGYNQFLAQEKSKQFQGDLTRRLGVVGGQQSDPDLEAKRISRVVSIFQGIDPASLTPALQKTAGSAFEAEADRKFNSEQNANNFYTNMNAWLNGGSPVSIVGGESVVKIVNQAPDKATVSTKPKAFDTANYYNPNTLNTSRIGT